MQDKRTQLIECALPLFYKRGINQVGINEILSASGIAKKTLYHHFANKEALIVACLEYRHQVFMAWLERSLAPANSPQEAVHLLVQAYDDWFNNKAKALRAFKGCLFINTAGQVEGDSSEIFKQCKNHKLALRELLEEKLALNNASRLDAVCILMDGAITNAYLYQDLQASKKCLFTLLDLCQQNTT
ncbi:TetR/AcrR family transcriptional regulator [Marinomonas epiphytica]